jgi:hypothetical protein
METATFILTAFSLLVGGIAAVAAIYAVHYSREQLSLAREQAQMTPDLKIETYVDPPKKHMGAAFLVVEVSNGGRTAAKNVHGWVYFDAAKLGPYRPPPRPPDERAPALVDFMPIPPGAKG